LYVSCKKDFKPEATPGESPEAAMGKVPPSGGGTEAPCREELQPEWIADTAEVPTQLGAQLTGDPYSVAVMQQASQNLYGHTNGIVANKRYIRYKPATLEQLDQLLETDVELFDYPLDRDVVEEGDYYPQPGIAADEIPWF
jgi:hypothetical protein